jgi:hypothetical protein
MPALVALLRLFPLGDNFEQETSIPSRDVAMAFPLDIRFVKRAEGKLCRKLPLGYVVKMCHSNGGAVSTKTDSWTLFPIFDDSDRKRLKRTCNDIIREAAEARTRPGFPYNALAIGKNGGGDLLVLLAESETDRYEDAVYSWDHETDELTRVADTFEELDGGSA